jgi:ribonuclease BN (tRNA processing enzyme)
MTAMRKHLSLLVASALAAAALAACASAQTAPATGAPATQGDRLVLLGTGGGPIARVSRSQPANLLVVGGKTYLIDIGEGAPRQIVRAGGRLNAVDVVFITHLHFDHTAGLMGFLALDWQDRRRAPVAVYGPPGTKALVADTLTALGSGEAIFAPQLPDLPPMRTLFSGSDLVVGDAAEVYRDGVLRVTAVEDSHYGTMHLPETPHGRDRAYSYRFDTGRSAIVFTGDTGPSRAVEQLAKGADVLVSEVIDLPALVVSIRRRGVLSEAAMAPLIAHMAEEHLTPENVGRLAAAAGVGRVILTHFATPPGIETFDRAAMLAEIRKHYAGPVDFGEDLATYDLGIGKGDPR